MNKRIRIYLDTSVPNALLDDIKPERQEEMMVFWKKIRKYDVFISELVIKEMDATPNMERREKLLKLIKPFTVLPSEGERIIELAEAYINAKIVSPNYLNDVLHLAIASLYGIEVFVSWNYRHIVKVGTKGWSIVSMLFMVSERLKLSRRPCCRKGGGYDLF